MIPAELAAFFQEGVAIHIGTRNERLAPNGARATAVRIDADGVHLEVFVASVVAKEILADLESNGQAAIVFARPVDDRACQVKAVFVSFRQAAPEDRDLVMGQWNGFLHSLELIGIPRTSLLGWVTWPSVAIRLRATALFDQTPGPQAGAALT